MGGVSGLGMVIFFEGGGGNEGRFFLSLLVVYDDYVDDVRRGGSWFSIPGCRRRWLAFFYCYYRYRREMEMLNNKSRDCCIYYCP